MQRMLFLNYRLQLRPQCSTPSIKKGFDKVSQVWKKKPAHVDNGHEKRCLENGTTHFCDRAMLLSILKCQNLAKGYHQPKPNT